MVLYQGEDPQDPQDPQEQEEQPFYDEKKWIDEIKQIIKSIKDKKPELVNEIRHLYNEHIIGPEITGGCDNPECGKIFHNGDSFYDIESCCKITTLESSGLNLQCCGPDCINKCKTKYPSMECLVFKKKISSKNSIMPFAMFYNMYLFNIFSPKMDSLTLLDSIFKLKDKEDSELTIEEKKFVALAEYFKVI